MARELRGMETEPATGGVDAAPPAGPPPAHVGHFTIERPLGAGGMGMVFAARDVKLGRRVALKLVHPRIGDERGHARLLREAQALAKLSHPNVVTVHEVGEVDGKVWIAMELMDGPTLRERIATPRPWREIARTFAAVGRGLAAVHELGLVHRDVKPSNVFVSSSGAVKLGDFGLVTEAGVAPDSDEHGEAPRSPAMTRSGDVQGTPAYMAPEQAAGGAVDARADLYSFCVSLHEALTGSFPDETPARELPRQLRPIVRRGLEVDPAARWPSMDALVSELERAARPARTPWIVAAVAAGGAAVAALALALARGDAPRDPCPAPTARLAGVWDAPVREATRAHLSAIDPTLGATRFAVAAARLDAYATAWADMHVASCRATRVTGEQSDAMLDLRARCLDRRLAALRSVTADLRAATSALSVDLAIAATATLEPLELCADTAALAEEVPPPSDPALRARAEAVLARVEVVRALQRKGAYQGLVDQAAGVVAEARAVGHAPTLATALDALAGAQLAGGDSSAAAVTYRELTEVASAARQDHATAAAWSALVRIVGYDLGKIDEATGLASAARAAVVRAGSPLELTVKLLYAEAILLEGTRPKEAVAKLDEARALLEKAGGRDAGSPLTPILADMVFESSAAKSSAGDGAGAIAALHESIALYRQAYGPDHPEESFAWHNLGAELRKQGKPVEAVDAFRQALRIREAREGEGANVAWSLLGLGAALQEADRWADALPVLERGARICREKLAPDDPLVAQALITLGKAHAHDKRWPEARAAYDEALALFARTGAVTSNLAITQFNRGNLEVNAGTMADAIGWYDRAVATFVKVSGPTHHRLVYPLEAKGRVLVLLGRHAEAIAPLEQALALELPGMGKAEQASARFYLGRALVDSGTDRARGLREAKAARAELVALKRDTKTLDDWLRGR